MKTIDTTKLWVVNPETDSVVPEICGPHGICMDVHGATTGQAQEIADMLNPLVGVEGQVAEFTAPYSVNFRAGDTEVTYSAPSAEEVMDMVARGEQRIEASPEKVEIKINSIGQLETKGAEQTLVEAYKRLQAERTRANDLDAYNERLKAELAEAVHLRNRWHEAFKSATERFEEADHGRRTWESNAASYLRSMHWYQEQLDICGRAVGLEAFMCDDGESPLRAKVAELVVKLCAERKGLSRSQVHEIVAGAVYSFASKLTTRKGVMTVGSACDAAPMGEAANEFCKTAGLVGEPDVKGWESKIALFLDHEEAGVGQVANPVRDACTNQAVNGPRLTPEQADRFVTVTAIKRGPCAKQTVTATIVTSAGERFVGTNDCANPQTSCPRDAAGMKTGEGYHLCGEVCQQTDHAEINALRAAGEKARDGVMYIEGHTYACEPCRQAMVKAGLSMYRFIASPAETERAEELPFPGSYPEALRELAERLKHKHGTITLRMLTTAADELQAQYEKTSSALGVGDGSGSLFVYGSYDAIKAVQRRVLRSKLPHISTLRNAFRTEESGTDGYKLVLRFKGPESLHRAANEFRALDHAVDNDGK